MKNLTQFPCPTNLQPYPEPEISILNDDFAAEVLDWEDYCALCEIELNEQIASLEDFRKRRQRREAILNKVLPLATYLCTGYLLTHFLVFLSRQ